MHSPNPFQDTKGKAQAYTVQTYGTTSNSTKYNEQRSDVERQVGQRSCTSRRTAQEQNNNAQDSVQRTCNKNCTGLNTLYRLEIEMHPPSAENIIPQIMQKDLPGPLAPNSCPNRFNKKTLACRLYIRNLSGVIHAFDN